MFLLQNESISFSFEKSMNSYASIRIPSPPSRRFSSGTLCHHLLGQKPLIFYDSETNMHNCIDAWRTTTRNERTKRVTKRSYFIGLSVRVWGLTETFPIIWRSKLKDACRTPHVQDCNEMIWNMTRGGSQHTKVWGDSDGVNEYQRMLCIDTSANSCQKELIRTSLFFR